MTPRTRPLAAPRRERTQTPRKCEISAPSRPQAQPVRERLPKGNMMTRSANSSANESSTSSESGPAPSAPHACPYTSAQRHQLCQPSSQNSLHLSLTVLVRYRPSTRISTLVRSSTPSQSRSRDRYFQRWSSIRVGTSPRQVFHLYALPFPRTSGTPARKHPRALTSHATRARLAW